MTHQWLLSYDLKYIFREASWPMEAHGKAGVREFCLKYEGYGSRVFMSGSMMPSRDSEGSGIANTFPVGPSCSVPERVPAS